MLSQNENYILTPDEVRDELLIGKNSVYKLLNEGTLEGFKVGTRWKIPVKSLNKYIDKCLQKQ